MAFFQKRNNLSQSPKTRLETQYNSARYNLYLAILFTAINLVLVLIQSDSYFLFSAIIPYYIITMAMFLCGKMPAEYYDPTYEYEFYDNTIFIIAVIVAVAITLAYLLCAVFSRKKRVGWIIAATALFAIDTVALFWLYGIALDMLLDYLFHAWILYYLIAGLAAHYKLKKLPPETDEPASTENEFTDELKIDEETFNSGFENNTNNNENK